MAGPGFFTIFSKGSSEELPPEISAPSSDDTGDDAGESYREEKSQYFEKLMVHIDEISIRPFRSIIFGIVMCSLLAVLGIGYSVMVNSSWVWIVAVVIAALYFYVGLIDVPIGWRGVPLIFGGRNKPWSALFYEGNNWVPRPFISAEFVDMRERTNDVVGLDIIATGTLDSTDAEKSEGEDTSGTSSRAQRRVVEVHFDPSIQWRIWDPWKVLSTGEEVVMQGLEKVVRDAFRTVGTRQGDDQLMRNRKTVKQMVEHAADRRSDRWGILVLDLPIERVRPKDEKVLDSYQKLTIEAQERPAEVVEREHVIVSSKRLMEELQITGESALMAFDDSRGKARRRKRVVVVGDVDPMTRAAAVLADGLENRGDE